MLIRIASSLNYEGSISIGGSENVQLPRKGKVLHELKEPKDDVLKDTSKCNS